MDEYRTCLNHLIGVIHEALQAEASKQILYHRTRAKGLENIEGMVNEIHKHRYMVEYWERAARDLWEIFMTDIKELRDNG